MVKRRSVFAVLAIVQLFFATLAIAGKIALRELSSSALVLAALMAVSILGERPSARLIPSAVHIAAGVAVTIHEQRAREAGPSPADQSMVEV